MRFLFVVKPLSYEWLGIQYVSAVLKRAGVECALFTAGDDMGGVVRWKPDFIGYSVLTGDHRFFLEFNRELKKKLSFTSVFGGPHPTFFPQMAGEKGVDYIVRGEAENSVLRVLEKPSGKVLFEPLPEDLDAIPYPDRELLYSYNPSFAANPIKHFIASRGCPFDCPYCYNNINAELYPRQQRLRFRSPGNVLGELEAVTVKYPTKFVYFQDDCFNLNRKWLKEFLPLYKQKIGLPFHCIVRLDLLDEELVKELKAAGCACVRCALESGNDHMRNVVLKRAMSKEQVFNGVNLLRKHSISFVLQNILGLPGGSLAVDLETLRVNIQCKPTLGWSSIFQPYPGTELGRLFPGITPDNISSSFYDESPIGLPYKKEVGRLQKLFGTVVRYPFLYPLLPLLLKLPLKYLYNKLWLFNNKRADRELYGGIL